MAHSLPTRVQAAGGSWLNLQHVAPHKSGPMINMMTNTSTTIVIRNMSIYDYLRQNLCRSKRHRSTIEPHPSPQCPASKLRKHNFSNYQRERERERESERENNHKDHRSGGRPSMDDYDIRFFFYLNSLILFTMSCSRQSAAEGDDLKHFICDRIRKFDRLRRKARKRRKRRPKQLTDNQMHL
ncbi:hypothetical protein M5D96_011801 [Drosophila gunungcola]|uniref:Uncharacterized protein n=1 Tax=Drosophila gunungcola TaxID=103775 RepID=A0A9P9YES9_9MUSC|nr:hypothetical protein M5D96_011801 [Drosophila gunungcola]